MPYRVGADTIYHCSWSGSMNIADEIAATRFWVFGHSDL